VGEKVMPLRVHCDVDIEKKEVKLKAVLKL